MGTKNRKMKKREKMPILNKVCRDVAKAIKLRTESERLRQEAQVSLNKLARKACPFKKDQIFKKGSVWAKVREVKGLTIRHGRTPEDDYWKAPFVLECKRCNSRGKITDRTAWIWINGTDIGVTWKQV
jgi:hypothetical protein